MEYKITGIDRRGKRFRLVTSNRLHWEGINVWRGTKWYRLKGCTRWVRYAVIVN